MLIDRVGVGPGQNLYKPTHWVSYFSGPDLAHGPESEAWHEPSQNTGAFLDRCEEQGQDTPRPKNRVQNIG